MKIHNALAAIALAVVGFGCQGDRTAPSGSQPGQMQGPADGRLIEDLSIGVVNGPGEYAFGRVSDVAMGPDGSIYVADAQAAVVRHYDAGGRFIRNLGREGSGPGEFVSPEHLAISPDGRVLIGDLSGSGARAAGRIHVYSTEGAFLSTWNFEDYIEGPLVVDSVGTAYVRIWGTVSSSGREGTRPYPRADLPLSRPALQYLLVSRVRTGYGVTSPGTIRVGADGLVLDTIPAPPTEDHLLYWLDERTGSRIYVGYTYAPFSWWAWSPLGHFLSGVSSDYAINVHAPGGAGQPLVLRRDLAAVPVVAEEQEEIRITLEHSPTEGGQWYGHQEIPSRKPAYHSVFVSRQGTIWVGVHLPSVRKSGEWQEPVTAFDVWHPNGEYRGRVEGPPTIRRAVIDGDTLLTWMRDELGVERVVRYRVEWD